MMAIRADRTLYMDETRTRVVEKMDPRARHLLIPRGHIIDYDTVQRLGLYVKDGRVQQRQAAGPSYNELKEQAKKLGINPVGKKKADLEALIRQAMEQRSE